MNKATVLENQTKDIASTSKPNKRIREDKPRKKDEKSLEHVFRALDSLGSTEHKLGAMCQKYAEMYNDHRMLQGAIKQAEKKNTVLQKEKEQLQSEHSKAILTRSRLENLCRELQRQNKAVKEECMLKMREEGEKKREVAVKFHSMLSEIGSLLAQNNNKNAKLRDDNLDMSMRLKSVCDQFEKKEQHVENLAKQMELEMQLADAKLAKAKMEMDIEKETLEKEKQALIIELAEYKRKLVEMKTTELTLREQLKMYSDKYEDFHKALATSNTAIVDFKSEMDRMTRHTRRLEKEAATWMSRYDAAQRTLTEVSQGKIRSDEALALSERRLAALQGICRGLQDQCRQLRGEQRRDSQAEEEYKKLEDQIKDVERSADIDSRPCSRKLSPDLGTEPAAKETQSISHNCSDSIENNENGNISCIKVDNSESESKAPTNIPLEIINKEEKIHDDNPIDESSEKIDLSSPLSLNKITEPIPNAVNHNLSSNEIIVTNGLVSNEPSTTESKLVSDSGSQCLIKDQASSPVNVNHVNEVSLPEQEHLLQINGEKMGLPDVSDTKETELVENESKQEVPRKPCSSSENTSIQSTPSVISDSNGKDIEIDGTLCDIGNAQVVENGESQKLSNIISHDPPNKSCGTSEITTGIGGTSPDDGSQTKNKKKRKSKK